MIKKKYIPYSDRDPLDVIRERIALHISPVEYKIFLFGSRVKGTADEYSDYDIGILGAQKLPLLSLARLSAAFDETPYNVDIVDFTAVDPKFKALSLRSSMPLF